MENIIEKEINSEISTENSKAESQIDLDNYKYYINRQLSWLDFNERVLDQALNKTIPLLERLKFLCIFSTNLDEFFMIRVAGLKQQLFFHSYDTGPDNLSPTQQIELISEKVHDLVKKQYQCFYEDIQPSLSRNNIHILKINQLNKEQEEFLKEYWDNTIFPILTPLAIDPGHPFPHLPNKSFNLVVEIKSTEFEQTKIDYAIVQIPKVIKRLIKLPTKNRKENCFILLEDVVLEYIEELFPGLEISQTSLIRITRNNDLSIVEEEASDLLKAIQEEVRRKKWGNVVRLEISSSTRSEIVINALKDNFEIETEDIYYIEGPLNLPDFFDLTNIDISPHLKYESFIPYDPLYEYNKKGSKKIYDLLRNKEILLYHPYESFQGVLDLITNAAEDPSVLAMKQTLYRTGKDSPIIQALIRAAENGKEVTALVELKARFDEEDNIIWAKQLEEAGVNVVYGLIGLKTHCKISMIVRQEGDKIKRYIHLGTGNYNHRTAKLYSDIGFLTSDKKIGKDVSMLFNAITGYSKLPPLKKTYAAPINLRERFEELIRTETENKKNGKHAYIVAKMNSLVDKKIIKLLYEASIAGVKIDLIVRGICCLKPQIKNISENIRVFSIIDRFLEHARIYYFYNDGDEKLYLSSSDWMPRNLDRRFEVMFPIEEPELKKRLYKEILLPQIDDNSNCYELKEDCKYHKRNEEDIPKEDIPKEDIPKEDISKENIYRYQFEMIKLAEKRKQKHKIPIKSASTGFIKKKKKSKK